MMKLSITYLYTIVKYGYPPSIQDDFRALEDIERMGFKYLEMEGLGEEHTRGLSENINEYKKRLDGHGIHVHNFCIVDPNLVSLDDKKRKAAYEALSHTAQLGAALGTETLHLASYAPPVEYIDQAPYQLDEQYAFGDTFKLRIPEKFSWQRVWDVLVESCTQAARTAAQYNKTVIMEPRVGEVICSADSLIRLVDDVGMDNFKANLDTGHLCAQRENIPLALKKLEGRFANIHLSDNDPKSARHLPVGDGMIEWREFFRVLNAMQYDGYLGLDLGPSEDLPGDFKRSVEVICAIAQELGIKIEY